MKRWLHLCRCTPTIARHCARTGQPARTDFSLLQQDALNILEANPCAGDVFSHVIVDEYQDTNTIQERIFFKLAAVERKNICVVGDDDQALYRFRGATVENFVEFPGRCQQHLATLHGACSLNTNYRSRQRIVDFYTSFIQQANWGPGLRAAPIG